MCVFLKNILKKYNKREKYLAVVQIENGKNGNIDSYLHFQ